MRKTTQSEALQRFPTNDMWLFFIDGHRLNEGPYAFDHYNPYSNIPGENGYIQCLINTWDMVVKSIERPIDIDFIKYIHDLTISKIPEIEEFKGFRKGSCSFGLKLYTSKDNYNEATFSEEGLKELIIDLNHTNASRLNSKRYPANCISYVNQGENLLDDRTYFVHFHHQHARDEKSLCAEGKLHPENAEHLMFSDFINIVKNNKPHTGNFILLANSSKESEIISWLQSDLNSLQSELSEAKHYENEDLVIRAIVHFTRSCLQSHYFDDGNGRTFAHIMMNYLLIQNGLSPVILMTPNHFSGFSLTELVLEVKQGMKLFQDFSNNKLCEFLEQSTNNEILKSHVDFRINLVSNLSSHPLVRLCQLNDAIQRIESNQLTLGNKFSRKWTKNNIDQNALQVLGEVYRDEFYRIRDSILPEEANPDSIIRSQDALHDLISRHPIASKLNLMEQLQLSKPHKL